MLSIGFLSELHRTASWDPDTARTPIEHLIEFLLTGARAASAPAEIGQLAEQVMAFDTSAVRAVILGGGTGLSTVVGGNSQMPEWPEQPHIGLKDCFPNLDIIVCTTDDGGSTGKLLKSLPMIGIGDLRKLLISSILPEKLERRYGLSPESALQLVRTLHWLFTYRFPEDVIGFEPLADPLSLLPPELRDPCPAVLSEALRTLGRYISPGGLGPLIAPAGHSMGNLLLTSAIFLAGRGRGHRAPGLREVQAGIDFVASLIGAPRGRIHAATAAPGQLKFRYANGVEVYGQSKSALVRRGSAVERVTAEFVRKPAVSSAVRSAIEGADLIIYAPGSLYTSIIPILQLEPIVSAIRANTGALKVLGANSWIQEGETDITLKNQGRGFLVSDLIEAYDRNVHLGIEGLFDVVLSANLERVPGNILRNYALEGKSPIHMDRAQVEAMGFRPVEATLFSSEHEKRKQIIQHDARRFALAIRTLLYADRRLKDSEGYALRVPAEKRKQTARPAPVRSFKSLNRGTLLCDYMDSMRDTLSEKEFRPAALRDFLLEILWQNRDIRPAHLAFFRGAVIIPPADWDRNTEWDNILGYYDPQDQLLKLHRDLLKIPLKIQEDLLVALGESLLGRYIEERRWIPQHGARTYEILLKDAAGRHSFLTDAQLDLYLRLSRMTRDPDDKRRYRITINDDEGFLPPGLHFGLMYAWYLCGRGRTMDYEMSLLRWPAKSLIPLHARDRIRKEALVRFFRTEIFGHPDE